MKISSVWFQKYDKDGLLGFADVTFVLADGENLTVKGFKITKEKGSVYVLPPTFKRDGELYPVIQVRIQHIHAIEAEIFRTILKEISVEDRSE